MSAVAWFLRFFLATVAVAAQEDGSVNMLLKEADSTFLMASLSSEVHKKATTGKRIESYYSRCGVLKSYDVESLELVDMVLWGDESVPVSSATNLLPLEKAEVADLKEINMQNSLVQYLEPGKNSFTDFANAFHNYMPLAIQAGCVILLPQIAHLDNQLSCLDFRGLGNSNEAEKDFCTNIQFNENEMSNTVQWGYRDKTKESLLTKNLFHKVIGYFPEDALCQGLIVQETLYVPMETVDMLSEKNVRSSKYTAPLSYYLTLVEQGYPKVNYILQPPKGQNPIGEALGALGLYWGTGPKGSSRFEVSPEVSLENTIKTLLCASFIATGQNVPLHDAIIKYSQNLKVAYTAKSCEFVTTNGFCSNGKKVFSIKPSYPYTSYYDETGWTNSDAQRMELITGGVMPIESCC